MSFTKEVKEEIINLKGSRAEDIASLSAYFRTNAKYEENKIVLFSELSGIATWVQTQLKDIYNVESVIEVSKNITFSKNSIYYMYICDKVQFILADLSVVDEKGNFLEIPRDYINGDAEEKKAYIRGIFLSKGSINDPKTAQYHLEFLFDNKYEAVFVQRLLNEFDLNSKILLRDKKYMIYIKDSEKISDFLKILGAFNAVMYYENIRVFKEQKNITNRLNNCEQANTDKIIQTAMNQIRQIRYIEEKVGIDLLDDKLKEAALYRIKYPDASLIELSEIISLETNKKITKSGLNHRFRKIRDMYDKLINNN